MPAPTTRAFPHRHACEHPPGRGPGAGSPSFATGRIGTDRFSIGIGVENLAAANCRLIAEAAGATGRPPPPAQP